MKKIFIEDARIESFMVDLRQRRHKSLAHESNTNIKELIIVGVGESGTQVAKTLIGQDCEHVPDFSVPSRLAAVQKDNRDTFQVFNGDGTSCALDDLLAARGDGEVAYLLLDGVCRSGQTLTAIYAKVRAVSKRVWTYAVAVSVDSALIPTWYGCLYNGCEYVVLTRDGATPNIALFSSKASKAEERLWTPALVLRPPLGDDPDFEAKAPSLARYTSDDRAKRTTAKVYFCIKVLQ